MMTERRLTIRSAVNNDSKQPFMHLLLTPWLCFAFVVDKNGHPKTIPGVSLASAQSNGLAYIQKHR